MTTNPITIPLKEGEQIWELLATDKFGLSPDELISDKVHGLGVVLDAVLSRAAAGQPSAPAPWQEIGTGNNTFRVGSARPVEVLSIAKVAPNTPGKVIADRNTYAGDGIPTVVGQQPSWVTIRLWWRAPDTTVPWPAFTSLFPALPDLDQVNGAEWVLWRALLPLKPTTDPGDQSWGAAQVERAASVGGSILKGLFTIVAVVGAGLLIVMKVRKGK